MSNTSAVHTRFWATMGERFGKRWLDEYGEKPSKAWAQLIDRHQPADLAEALSRLKDRPEQQRAHPPSHAEFEALLVRAQRDRKPDPTDFIRAYWRSVILGTCISHARLLRLMPIEGGDIRNIDSRAYSAALHAMHEQLEWACETERKNQQRTPEMEQHVNQQLWRAMKHFERDEPPAPRRSSERTPSAGELNFTMPLSGG